MFQKLMVINLLILKQELLIMQALKFGEINHTTAKVISGLLDVLFIKWQLLNHLFKARICKIFLNASKKRY